MPRVVYVQLSISNQKEEFQGLILDVLHRELVPDITSITQGNENFKTLLSESIKLLKNDMKWLTSLSNKQRFCWGFLATCCSKIIVSTENTDWANHFCTIFTEHDNLNLGTVFSAYCREKDFNSRQCIIATGLPAEIKYHPLEDLHK